MKACKATKKILNKYEKFHEAAKTEVVERKFREISYKSLNSGQRAVVDLVTSCLDTNTTLLALVAGEGGTGKSFIIQKLRNIFRERKIRYKVVCFTGSASNGIQGETVHSVFRIGYFSDLSVVSADPISLSHLQNIKWYIIDEVYTLGCRLLGNVSEKLKLINFSSAPFGNCSVIAFGDISQNRPIADFSLFKRIENLEPNTIESKGFSCYMMMETAIVLKEQMRVPPQEMRFKELLRRVRVGQVTSEDLSLLRSREAKYLTREEQMEFATHAVVVFPDRCSVGKYNEFRLKQTENPIITIPSLYSSSAPEGIESSLSLSIGTPVVLTNNVNTRLGLFNGKLFKIYG